MITIKRDKEWVKVESWADVEGLPGYVPELDPKAVELDAVFGWYHEPELHVCGLSNCHTRHYRGYLVSTKDGQVTNIGHECGATQFGVEFETMSRQLDRDWQSQERREAVRAALARVPEWQARCAELLHGERGASWLDKEHRVLSHAASGLPAALARVVRDLIRSGDETLVRVRVATEREREIARETGQRVPQEVREEVGELAGVAVLGRIEELRELLPRNLEPGLATLAALDVEQASDSELRHWAKWVSEVEGELRRAADIVDAGRVFFTKDNVSQLAELATTGSDEKAVMRLARRYA